MKLDLTIDEILHIMQCLKQFGDENPDLQEISRLYLSIAEKIQKQTLESFDEEKEKFIECSENLLKA